MSAKVNMEAPPKEQDPTPLDPSSSSPSDGLANKARPQPHTTTAFLLQGEFRSEGSRLSPGFRKTILEPEDASVTTVPTSVWIKTLTESPKAYLRNHCISKISCYWIEIGWMSVFDLWRSRLRLCKGVFDILSLCVICDILSAQRYIHIFLMQRSFDRLTLW